MRILFLFILLFILALSSQLVFGYDYNRTVSMEWEEIPGADSYEVEWFTGADCQTRGGVEKLGKSPWEKRMPAGNYCMRVRGISGSDVPGDWTEMKKTALKPKAPHTMDHSGKIFHWDKVPYAESYRLELVDGLGKSIYSTEVTQNEFTIPDSILKDPKLYEQDKLKLKVQTLVKGVSPSSSKSEPFSMKSIAPPPVIAQIKAPVPKVLDRRLAAIEQQRTEELFDRKHPYDLRLEGGLSFGPYSYISKNQNANASPGYGTKSAHAMGPAYRIEAHYQPEGAWGAFAKFDGRVISLEGATSSYTAFNLGAQLRLFSNSSRTSVLTGEMGLMFSQRPYYLQNDPSRLPSNISLSHFGVRLGLDYRLDFSRRWAMQTGTAFSYIPQQAYVGNSLGFSGIGGGFSASAIYGLSSHFELRGGLDAEASKINAATNTGEITIAQASLSLQGIYHVNPTTERSPAAETRMEEDIGRVWKIGLAMPWVYKRPAILTIGLGDGSPQGGVSTTKTALDLSLERKISAEGPWSFGVTYHSFNYALKEETLSEMRIGVYGGYEGYLRSRRDLRWFSQFGFGLNQNTIQGRERNQIKQYELQLAAGVEKVWSRLLTSQIDAGIDTTLFTGGELAIGGAPKGDGFNFLWHYGLSLGFKVFNPVTFWTGYRFQRVRYPGNISEGPVNGSVSLDSTEDQLRLGVTVAW